MAWLRAALAGAPRGLRYLGFGLVTGFAALALIPATLLVAVLGWPLLPDLTRGLRRFTGWQRKRIEWLTGKPVPELYLPLEGSFLRQYRTVVTDPQSRRDLAWLALHAVTGPVLGLLALGLPLAAVNAVSIPAYWWALPPGEPAAPLYPVTSWAGAIPMPLVGVAYVLLWLLMVSRVPAWQAGWSARLLGPPPGADLTLRVAELTASRAAALEAHGAELRRIERNLHDGTQNKLVAVVMQLGIAERALRRDPDAALPLILKAQNAAGDALRELRDVVRGIYPPVLAERGLDGAVAALVARCPVPCELVIEELRRAPAAVESAAYFVVAEALTNIAKHSGATRASVTLGTTGGELLMIEVRDDGHGGADEAAGTGLVGIRRRVAAFDGQASLSSPDGGPTVLRVELPCGS